MSFTEEELQLIDVVASDLHFLREEWDNEVDDHSLRRSSPVLRRLLVENDLHRTWKAAGFEGQASLRASTLDPVRQSAPTSQIAFAVAGGASYKGAQLRGFMEARGSLARRQMQSMDQQGFPDREYKILEFVEDPSVIVRGTLIKRRHVIKYVSNKLGGAHLDPRRGRRKDDDIYALLDTVATRYELLEKPAIYFELLSIGQAIVASSDVRELETALYLILKDSST